MARGGIYDQLGGGFHRYAVDAHWLVPHFEKMLYDNAQLAPCYLEAYQLTERTCYCAHRPSETLDYVLREMTRGGRLLRRAGRRQRRQRGQVLRLDCRTRSGPRCRRMTPRLLKPLFGVREGGNFEGATIPTLIGDPEAFTDELESIRQTALRSRIPPRLARPRRKIITSWNGMMIRAFAEGGLVLDRPDFIDAARTCASFLRRDVDVDGVLHRSFGGGSARIPAFPRRTMPSSLMG